MKLMLVVGARPQIIKSAPIIHQALRHKEIELQLVHTGQHYDFQMSRIFFQELTLPDPIVNLGVGSGTHGQQTGRIMIKLEKKIILQKPDLVMVPGDTNSALAAALTAAKLHIPVAHVESGARSYDMRMPEEINRRLTDHCSLILLAPTENCSKNLQIEGIPKQRITLSGDTMYDALLQHSPFVAQSKIIEKLRLRNSEYAVLTLHRPENVDTPESLTQIATGIRMLDTTTIVFPTHPRTKQRLARFKLLKSLERLNHVRLVEPLGYHDMLKLIKHATIVLTDSGGVQKEAFWLHTPCITLRETTEWGETVELGANVLVGHNSKKIVTAAKRFLEARNIKAKLEKSKNPFGDGRASEKIVQVIMRGNQ